MVAGLAFLSATSAVVAEFDGPAPLAWRWAQPTSAAPFGSPMVNGNTVYAAVGGRLYAIERETGNQVWRYPAGEPISGSFRLGAAMGKDLIVAASDDKSLYAVDAKTGQLAWQYLSENAIVSTPVIAGDAAVFANVKNELVAVGLSDGKALWGAPYKSRDGVHTTLGAWQNLVIFTTNGSNMVALDMATQRVAWETKFSRLSAVGSYTIFGDRIYVNSGSFVTCVRANNGRVIWQQNTSQTLSYAPAASADGVVSMARNGQVFSFDPNGRPIFKKGVDLGAPAAASPTFAGKMVVATTTSGTLSLINPLTGDVLWNFTMPVLVKGQAASSTPAGGTGASGTGFGSGAPPGGGDPAGQTPAQSVPTYVQAAGSPVVSGDTLFVLARDGSIFAFDKNQGVDLTAPEVLMLWPNAGDQVAGKAPMELLFKIDDLGSGVNPDTVSITIGGENYLGTFSRDGYLSVKISAGGQNRPLQNGRKVIVIKVSDWMGNMATAQFAVSIDNNLPALGSPRRPDPNNNAGGGAGAGAGGDG